MKIETEFGLSRDGYRNQRALLIGINYKGSKSPLYGCQNDVLNMKVSKRKAIYKYIYQLPYYSITNRDILEIHYGCPWFP